MMATTSRCPARALANLKVLEATGNLPKTVPRLLNVLKPFSSQLVFLSPWTVLDAIRETQLATSDGGGAGDTLSDLNLKYVHREGLKDTKLIDKRTHSHAAIKARNNNAVLVEVNDKNEPSLISVSEEIKEDFTSRPLAFTHLGQLESYLERKCISNVVQVDPNAIITQLKDLGLIYVDDSGVITYSPTLIDNVFAAITTGQVEDLYREMYRYRSPVPDYSDEEESSMETNAAADAFLRKPPLHFSPHLSDIVAILQTDSLLVAALKRIKTWGNDRPKTEQKLANALKPTCKVIRFHKPSEVLKKLGKRFIDSKLTVQQEKTLQWLSIATLFRDEESQSPAKKQGKIPSWLSSFQKQLFSQAHRSNSSINYISEIQPNDTLLQATVQRLKEWVVQKQNASKAVVAPIPPLGVKDDGQEPMVVEAEAPPYRLPSKASLAGEFLHLCVTRDQVDPAEMIQSLEAESVIKIGENGIVTYTGIPKTPPDCEEGVKQCMKLLAERVAVARIVQEKAAAIRQRAEQTLARDRKWKRASGIRRRITPARGGKRRIRNQGRSAYKKSRTT